MYSIALFEWLLLWICLKSQASIVIALVNVLVGSSTVVFPHLLCVCVPVSTIYWCLGFKYLSKIALEDFLGSPVIKNTPRHAGDTGSTLSWGTKILLASEQLSPHAETTEDCMLWCPCATAKELLCLNKRSSVPQLRFNAAK